MKNLSKKENYLMQSKAFAPKLVAIEALSAMRAADGGLYRNKSVATALGKNPKRSMSGRTSGRNRTKK